MVMISRHIVPRARLVGVTAMLVALLAAPAAAQDWTRSWEAAMQGSAHAPARIATLQNQTLRQVIRTSVGGARWRLRLSNEKSPAALHLGAVHVALQAPDGSPIPGSDRTVRFSGAEQAGIAAGAAADSDPIALPLPPLARVVVSLYFPDTMRGMTFHAVAMATGEVAPGDQSAAPTLTDVTSIVARGVLAAVDVGGASPRQAVVAIGDSITDGVGSTPNANSRWPDLLADRLQAAHRPIGVANAGIASNQLLRDGVGESGVGRFAADALAAPGVSHVIILEGINDILISTRDHRPLPTPGDLIGGYRRMIAEAHAKRVKVILGTLLPFRAARNWTAEGETVRAAVNQWIRSQHEADGVVDFARAAADPANPLVFRPGFVNADGLHPTDTGYRAMADAVDLALLG